MVKEETPTLHEIISAHAASSILLKNAGYPIVVLPHVKPGECSAADVIDKHTWGTLGQKGVKPYKEVRLVDCSTEHLKNILRTEAQITPLTALVIMAILLDRDSLELK
jgi:cytochrome b